MSWQVCKNPVTLAIGGIAAVILELAEPRVREGVWRHTRFREQPLQRLQRTGLATMVTVYGARSRAERMIAAVSERHRAVRGTTPEGEAYDATDPELLDWVHATAAWGFVQAWHVHVRALPAAERDRWFDESRAAAVLYGAASAPRDEAAWQALLERMRPRLAPSPVIFEFLQILQRAPLLPSPLRPLQRLLVRAAVELVPAPLHTALQLHRVPPLRAWQRWLVGASACAAERLVLPSSPPVQACLRLGLRADHLYARRD